MTAFVPSKTTRQTIQVTSDKVKYAPESIESEFNYTTTQVITSDNGSIQCEELTRSLHFKTERKVGRVGVMMIGLAGNNGTTLSAGILANRKGLSWEADRKGKKEANWYGSVLESGTMRLGTSADDGKPIYVPLKDVVPLADASDIVLGGWDLIGDNLAVATQRAQVIPVDLQKQLHDDLEAITPYKGIFIDGWVATNQASRVNWSKNGSLSSMKDELRSDIRDFSSKNQLDTVIVFWSGNTERFSIHTEGVHDSSANFIKGVQEGHSEISPSSLYCLAAIEEGCTFINGSPQNTFCPALIQHAQAHGTFLAGDDLKTGQTKMKSVLTEFLVASGLKVQAIASYNHLGNNDGLNLSEPAQFRSKEISKSDVVTDIIRSNSILYGPEEKPDHVVVIKYIPYVGDSKRAMDEYTSEMFLGGDNTIVMHNTCEDSLLAAPLMMDLILLAEFCRRVTIVDGETDTRLHMMPVLSLLSLFLKAPLAMQGASIVNAFTPQRAAITNFFRALVGLQPENSCRLEEIFKLSGLSDHVLMTQ